MKPKLFIGSASESKGIANALQQNLEDAADVTVWDQDVFKPGDFTLAGLEENLNTAEFGIFILTPDDLASIREKTATVPRDNVVFELGMFVGRLGRQRCFVIVPKQAQDLHIPSDLAGVTVVSYLERDDKNLRAATGPACTTIKTAIEDQKARLRSKNLIDQILESTARWFTLRAGVSTDEVRGFCHLFDAANASLQPISSYMEHHWEDAGVAVPCPAAQGSQDWFIIAKAFRQDRYQCAEVNWQLPNLEQVPHAMDVKRNLRSIIAHPIRPLPTAKKVSPIGTVAFDSSRSLQDLKWQDDLYLQDILSLLGASVYEVVTRMR